MSCAAAFADNLDVCKVVNLFRDCGVLGVVPEGEALRLLLSRAARFDLKPETYLSICLSGYLYRSIYLSVYTYLYLYLCKKTKS